MDIFASLRFDHAAMQDLADRLSKRKSESTALAETLEAGDWEDVFHDLKLALIAHNRAEEKILYELLREIPGREDMARAKITEHHIVEELLEDLEELTPADKAWEDKLKLFRQHLDAHIDEEETNVFPIVKPYISDDRARQIGGAFEQLRDDLIVGAPYHPRGRSAINPAGLDLLH